MNIEVEKPKVVEKYYATCAAIDQHNRCRQDDLQLERKIRVRDWDKRVNMGILGICVVDAWKLYKAGMGFQNGLRQAHIMRSWLKRSLTILSISLRVVPHLRESLKRFPRPVGGEPTSRQ